jgi:cell pole-organizing protein PopZ
MEEILASIRKIISEDAPEPAAAPAPAAVPAPTVAPVAFQPEPVLEADVLELTQEFEEPPTRFAPPPARSENDVVFETIEETPAMSAPSPSTDGIFSDHTRKAVEDTFANIPSDDYVAPSRAPAAAVAPVDGRTIEAVFEKAVRESFDPVLVEWLGSNSDAVIERMKPLIREWMDEHFPALLEGAVRNEVARVVKARGTR